MSSFTRRQLLEGAGAGLFAGAAARSASATAARPRAGALVIASANGLRTVEKAWQDAAGGSVAPVHAAVMGVAIQEDDPDDTSVGFGGLPNEEGVVQLDAACMDGPRHTAGAVAAIEGIRNPAQVAEKVMLYTDHVLLVGEGAQRFALSYGFPKQDLLTDRAREIWRNWRASHSKSDDYLSPEDGGKVSEAGFDRPMGTIHCSVLGPTGDLGCCTTTSGLAFKIPGRVGDSPLIGCGLYCDNGVGSAGATGRGEAAIHSGGSWLVVERMRAGDTPEAACLYALRRVAEQTERMARWQPGLWSSGRPTFQLRFYALRKDGLYGSASMLGREGEKNFAVCDATGARREAGAIAFSG
ncbi:MAG TPA: N(4)-(beta-N-acetylglucosaminyl)-L-asparaginase [Planctomycetota bacterium]